MQNRERREVGKQPKSLQRKLSETMVGVLVASSAVVAALPIGEAFACDPNNPKCSSNPGYTAHLVTNADKSKTISIVSVNGGKIRFAPNDRLPFGLQIIKQLTFITDYDNASRGFAVKDDSGAQGELNCTADYISHNDSCSGTLYPSQD